MDTRLSCTFQSQQCKLQVPGGWTQDGENYCKLNERDKQKQRLGQRTMTIQTRGEKSKEINIVNNLNQISKKSAWNNITLYTTYFFDTAASLHLVH